MNATATTTTTTTAKAAWTTYAISGYTHQVGDDARATGGVHRHEVRRTRAGHYQRRVSDANGRFSSPGPVVSIAEAEGEALFARAESR